VSPPAIGSAPRSSDLCPCNPTSG